MFVTLELRPRRSRRAWKSNVLIDPQHEGVKHTYSEAYYQATSEQIERKLRRSVVVRRL